MTLDLPSSLDVTIKEDRKWADSLLGKSKSKPKKASNSKEAATTKEGAKKKRKKIEDDDVVVVTDLRPIADRLHEKVEQAAAARKRKTESGDQPPPSKKLRGEKKPTKKHKKDSSKSNGLENGHTPTTTTTTSNGKHKPKPIPKEEPPPSSSDDELLEEDAEVIHIDDYYNELTERVLNANYGSPQVAEDEDDGEEEYTEDYDEEIRLKLLGLKKPEKGMSPEFEEDLQYGTFDFSSGQPIPKYLSKGAKRTKRLDYLIKKAERKQKVLAGNTERSDQIRWSSALSKATGVKDRDDVTKMKKLLNKIHTKKKKSTQEWTKRIEDMKAHQEKRQARRKANIQNKVASRKAYKINRRFGIKTKKKSNKAPSPAGNTNKKRPGFEGRKQNFLNK